MEHESDVFGRLPVSVAAVHIQLVVVLRFLSSPIFKKLATWRKKLSASVIQLSAFLLSITGGITSRGKRHDTKNNFTNDTQP